LALSPGTTGAPAAAWAALTGQRWTLYKWGPGSNPYAVCPACSKGAEGPDERAARARRGRKR
jgi:hypothetical protein